MNRILQSVLLIFVLPVLIPMSEANQNTKKSKSPKSGCGYYEMGPYFKTCKPVTCKEKGVTRTIHGMKGSKCKYSEISEIPYGGKTIKMKTNCMYPKSYLPHLAKEYSNSDNGLVKDHKQFAEKFSKSKTPSGFKKAIKSKKKKYLINDEETIHPQTLAMEKGICKIGGK